MECPPQDGGVFGAAPGEQAAGQFATVGVDAAAEVAQELFTVG